MQRGLVVLLSFLAAVCAQTSYTVTLNFTGGLPICTQCGPAGQYACSPTSNSPQIGEWNNGTLKFQDPLPSGLYASGITAVVYGSYGCSAVGGTQAVLGLTLNEQVIDFHQGSSDSYCKCNTCGGGMVFSSNPVNTLSPTLPYYNNQGSNTLQLDVYASSVCISSVVITINATKAASNQITMVEFPLNFSDSDCNLACGPAYQCWCSSFSGDYLQTTFSDPLPENAVLLAAAVAIYGSARGSNPYNISTTLAGLTIGSSPVTWDTDDTICSGRIYLYDTDIYQNGWPGYTYGGQNTVNLLPGNNYRFCIGTFVLQLYYYTTPSLFL